MSATNKCFCGCGEPVRPGRRYRPGHWARGRLGEQAPNWRGGAQNRPQNSMARRGGYNTCYAPGHPRAVSAGTTHVYGHVLVVEAAMGKLLRRGATILHVDGDNRNDRGSNLVVCHDYSYHKLLQRRLRAYRETGDPHALQCRRCGRWGGPEDINDKWGAHRGHCQNYHDRAKKPEK